MSTASPTRIVYVNGQFCPYSEAKLSIMDRGFLFGDGIYEVSAVLGGKLVDNEAHLRRLSRCLGEIDIRNPHSIAEWIELQKRLIQMNALEEGLVYIEVTRGVWERDFTCPPDLAPSVVMFTQAKSLAHSPAADAGVAVISVPDQRWARRDIKSVNLLGQVIAKFAAKTAGVAEAWMVEEGFVTEGASSSAFIISHANAIITRPLSQSILPGITREMVQALARAHGLEFIERAFTIEEAYAAREAFYTSAGSFVMPVIRIDDRIIGEGVAGPLATELRARYIVAARASAQ